MKKPILWKKLSVNLVWKIEFSTTAKKQLRNLDRQVAKKILKWLNERLLSGINPRLWGKQLTGSDFGDMWRYRIGDYRVLCIIKNSVVTIEVVSLGHRKEIYR